MKTKNATVLLTHDELLDVVEFLIELAATESKYHAFASSDHRRTWEINRVLRLMCLVLRNNPV